MDCQLLKGDCLEWIPKLPKHSVDFIFCDPPFGSIKEGRLKFIDKVIPPDEMWKTFRHVLKPSGTVVVFGTQPFISQVIVSNIKQFRYDLIWRKHQSGFLNCNNRPMREHQTIAVFSEKAPGYNPQMRQGGKPYSTPQGAMKSDGVYGRDRETVTTENDGSRFPSSIIESEEPGPTTYNPQFKPKGKAYTRKGSGTASGRGVLPRPVMNDYDNDGTRYFPTSIIEEPETKRDRSDEIYRGLPPYNPQMGTGKPFSGKRKKVETSEVYSGCGTKTPDILNSGTRYPSSIIEPESAVYNAQMEPGRPYLVKRSGTVLPDNCYKKRTPPNTNNDGERHPSSIITHVQAGFKNIHPFEKPQSLCEWIIKTYTNSGMTVLDPTMGGGSTGVACRTLGRKFIGIELDPKWFLVARDRIYDTPLKESVQS
jgi:DNA modification methylase